MHRVLSRSIVSMSVSLFLLKYRQQSLNMDIINDIDVLVLVLVVVQRNVVVEEMSAVMEVDTIMLIHAVDAAEKELE